MSRDHVRRSWGNRDWERSRDRDRDRERDFRSRPLAKRSRSPLRDDKRLSRSPRVKMDKDLDENILSEISKLPEPSELWETSQYQEASYTAPPPPSFQTEGTSNPPYNNYQPQPTYSGIYDDFPSVPSVPTPLPPDISSWNQLSLPPPPTAPAASFNVEDQIKKEAAIESEMRHQKAALSKQREDYMKKAAILKKEMETLKDQRNELRGDPKRSPSPDTKRFLKENTKLQLEIQNKLKTINNVVDMLNGIIGEEAHDLLPDSDDSLDRLDRGERPTKRKSRSPSNKKFNYVYYDPEMHWCRVCNEFPPTAKDYLNHLHSPTHQKMAAAHLEAPWHSVTTANEGFPSFASAPTKRTPIRGLQFFVPSTAWYCKLCDQFIGDLHCASAHLKSIVHSKNYTNFVEQNPHWETDWMSDRQKAFEKARGANKIKKEELPPKIIPAQYAAHTITFNKDGFHTKRKESPTPVAEVKEKKKKKEKRKKSKKKKSSSSSSSSDSSSSDSDSTKKKRKKHMANLHSDRLNESDRKLLDTLKSRMKRDKEEKREQDRERAALDASRKRDSERRSRERRESSRDRRGSRERREDSRSRRSPSRTAHSPSRKPEIRKMPFIGKMPVYKNLSKTTKTDDQKKDDQKKKDDEEASKKRREEMDAEIQKKVAEFKEKIAKAQFQQQVELGPPSVALPTQLGAPVPFLPQPAPAPTPLPAPLPAPAPPPPAPSNLSKDFQDALDIIFPSAAKQQELSHEELFAGVMPPGFPLPLPGVMPPFLPPGLMQQPMPGMMMNPFEMNPALFQPRPSLYDTHVPIVPSPKPRQNKRPQQQKKDNNRYNNQNNKNQNQNQNNQNQAQNNQSQAQNNQSQSKDMPAEVVVKEENGSVAKKKEELDDLAMLGIDASDVGAGI